MKIVKRNEFLKLPTPFMYIKCDKFGNTEGELSINCENINGIDWVVNSCTFEPNFDDSGERYDILNGMTKDSSINIPVIDMNTSRDGLYDEDQLFIVYTKEDFQLFVKTMVKYLHVYGTNKNIKYECN
jgi:hypothetical protein